MPEHTPPTAAWPLYPEDWEFRRQFSYASPSISLLSRIASPALDRFPGKQHLCSPLLRQIHPPRILCFNQSNLLRPSPPLQLLLPVDGFLNIIKALVVNHPVAAVLSGKSFERTGLVFQSSPVNVVRHPDIKRPRPAANDVSE